MIEPIALELVDHLLFILLGLVLPWRSIASQKKLKDIQFDPRLRRGLYLGNSLGLWLMAGVVLLAWWWFDRPYSTLGLIWTDAAFSLWSIGFILLFFLLYLFDTIRDLIHPKGKMETEAKLDNELAILPRGSKTYLFFVPLAFSAGICEEIVFRGFFITYFISLLGNQLAGQIFAILIPAIIFGFVHTYQGKQAIVKIVGMAVIFGLVFLLTGSIYWLIILHVVVDLIGGSIGLWFPEPETAEEEWIPSENQHGNWEEE